MGTTQPGSSVTEGRLSSLDFFRGLTMFLLVAEGALVYESLLVPELDGTWIQAIATQFTHHPWNGLRFWDLVQPFFMFIVGVAMPFSFARRWERGDSYAATLRHAVVRSLVLLGLGVGLYVVAAGYLTLELWNVLAQLSFTYLLAFLIMRKSSQTQLLVTVGLLVLTEVLYRSWPLAGYNQPFTPDQNFGSWLDMLLMGKLSGGHWVAVNAVPTAAHTIWGVLAGYVLMSKRTPSQKIKILLIAGVIGLVVGYGLNRDRVRHESALHLSLFGTGGEPVAHAHRRAVYGRVPRLDGRSASGIRHCVDRSLDGLVHRTLAVQAANLHPDLSHGHRHSTFGGLPGGISFCRKASRGSKAALRGMTMKSNTVRCFPLYSSARVSALLVAAFLTITGVNSPVSAQAVIQSAPIRADRSLDGAWHTIIDPYENGFYNYRYEESTDGYFRNRKPESVRDLIEYDFDASGVLNVPGDWNSQHERLFFYEGTIWYKKSFAYDLDPGRRLFVHVGAANYEAAVYLNGVKLGRHVGGFT
ncbi:MAG: DUF5009 domain-containing protein, partial [Gemmatimonadales bacterium]